MSDRKVTKTVLNVVLCGASGFGFMKAAPAEHPFAFTACLIGFCHGIVGLVETWIEDNSSLRSFHDTTGKLMEVIPLPLVNVDLFLAAESNNIALAHGLFLVPLSVGVLLAQIRGYDEIGDFSTHGTLKVLTILGNITSLVFLAINDGSMKLGAMAVLAFMAKFGSEYCVENIDYQWGRPVTYISWSGFYILAALAVSGEK